MTESGPNQGTGGGEVRSGGVEVAVFLTSWAHIYIESSHGVFSPLEVAGGAQGPMTAKPSAN